MWDTPAWAGGNPRRHRHSRHAVVRVDVAIHDLRRRSTFFFSDMSEDHPDARRRRPSCAGSGEHPRRLRPPRDAVAARLVAQCSDALSPQGTVREVPYPSQWVARRRRGDPPPDQVGRLPMAATIGNAPVGGALASKVQDQEPRPGLLPTTPELWAPGCFSPSAQHCWPAIPRGSLPGTFPWAAVGPGLVRALPPGLPS